MLRRKHGKTKCIRIILNVSDMDTARLLFNQVIEAYETKAPKAMAVLEAGFEDATAVLLLPPKYRKRFRTTNGLERLNEEFRRRKTSDTDISEP